MVMLAVLLLCFITFFNFVGWWALSFTFLYWVLVQVMLASANFLAK